MTYTVVKKNGNFLSGKAKEEVIDSVQKERTSCIVDGYTIHIERVTIDSVDNCTIIVSVEWIDG